MGEGWAGHSVWEMQTERWLGALREPNFRLYFIGQLTSSIGSGMAPVALSFAVLARSHATASQVGLVLTAQTVPLVLFLLVGGVAADRLGRRRVMLTADILRGLAEAILGAWVVLGSPPLWGFLVLSALVGTGTAFFMPALTGLIPEVVSGERLTQANALNGLTFSLGGIVGPAVAGVIVAAASPGWAICGDAVSYFVSVGCLAALRLNPVAKAVAESFFGQLRQGWSEFWSRTWLWTIVLQASISNMMLMAPFVVLGAVIAKASLGGATAWGSILGAEGVGSVVGGIIMLRIHVKRPLVAAMASLLVWPFPLLALAYRAPVVVIAAGALLGGASFAIFAALWDTTMQREIPSHLLSRVSAYDWFGSLVFMPLGYAIVGPIASVVGIHATFIAGTVYIVATVAISMFIPAVRQMRTPAPGPLAATGVEGVDQLPQAAL